MSTSAPTPKHFGRTCKAVGGGPQLTMSDQFLAVYTPELQAKVATRRPDSTHDGDRPALAGHCLRGKFGRYRILNRLGQGAMGTVYLAHDTQLDRRVALKVPHFLGELDSQRLERFYREARSAAAFSHPNVCGIFDVGQIDGVPYLTMAFIRGKPLSVYIQPERRLSRRKVAMLVQKLAQALAKAHKAGVIHRDLKPANVMLDKDGEPIIMDFGLAKRNRDSDARLTKLGTMVGTLSYMSPEQVRGDVDAMGPACDIYSLGVLLYELLTGRLPFEGPPAAVAAQILSQGPVPPSTFRPDLHPELEAIVLKAMANQIADRFATMDEFALALAKYLRRDRRLAPPPVRRPRTEEARPTPTVTEQVERVEEVEDEADLDEDETLEPEPCGRSWWKAWWLPVLVGGVVLLVAAGVWDVARKRDRAGSPPVPTECR